MAAGARYAPLAVSQRQGAGARRAHWPAAFVAALALAVGVAPTGAAPTGAAPTLEYSP
jgi:hypothetical protein